MFWPMLTLAILCMAAMGLICHQALTSANKRQGELLDELKQLRSDNRSLTEALAQDRGKPLVFAHSIEPQPSEGWFDRKTEER